MSQSGDEIRYSELRRPLMTQQEQMFTGVRLLLFSTRESVCVIKARCGAEDTYCGRNYRSGGASDAKSVSGFFFLPTVKRSSMILFL